MMVMLWKGWASLCNGWGVATVVSVAWRLTDGARPYASRNGLSHPVMAWSDMPWRYFAGATKDVTDTSNPFVTIVVDLSNLKDVCWGYTVLSKKQSDEVRSGKTWHKPTDRSFWKSSGGVISRVVVMKSNAFVLVFFSFGAFFVFWIEHSETNALPGKLLFISLAHLGT